jgi:hypothetical protein
MSRFLSWATALFIALTLQSRAIPWSPTDAVQYARNWIGPEGEDKPGDPPQWNTIDYNLYSGDCSNFGSQCARAGCGGAFSWLPTYASPLDYDTARCKPPIWVDDRGCIPRTRDLWKWLTRYLGRPPNFYCFPWQPRGKPGDFVFWHNLIGGPYHVGVVDSVDGNGDLYYDAHTHNRSKKKGILGTLPLTRLTLLSCFGRIQAWLVSLE